MRRKAAEDPPPPLKELRTYPKALVAGQVAEMLNKNVSAIYDLAQKKIIPSFRLGKSLRFDPQRLADWYDNQQIGAL